jgi:hypothetical protein
MNFSFSGAVEHLMYIRKPTEPKRNEVAREWTRLHYEKLYD